jgi:hypothetical protein
MRPLTHCWVPLMRELRHESLPSVTGPSIREASPEPKSPAWQCCGPCARPTRANPYREKRIFHLVGMRQGGGNSRWQARRVPGSPRARTRWKPSNGSLLKRA